MGSHPGKRQLLDRRFRWLGTQGAERTSSVRYRAELLRDTNLGQHRNRRWSSDSSGLDARTVVSGDAVQPASHLSMRTYVANDGARNSIVSRTDQGDRAF